MPEKNIIKNYFNKVSETWDSISEEDDSKISWLLDEIMIKKGDAILDVGCGTGIISKRLYDRSKRMVTAIDISDNMIKIAKSKLNDDSIVHFECRDFYDHMDTSFDLIVVFDAYPHFLDCDKFKKSALEKLNPDGRIAIIHDLGRQQLKDCHKGKDVCLISRELSDPITEGKLFEDEFNILKAKEGEDFYILLAQKKNLTPFLPASEENLKDKRIEKTKRETVDAFFSLLKEKPFDSIFTNDILKASGVSRTAFYNSFKSKGDIINSFVSDLLSHVLAKEDHKEDKHDFSYEKKDARVMIHHLFCHLDEDKEYISVILESSKRDYFVSLMMSKLKDLISSFIDCGIIRNPGIEKDLLTKIYLSSILTIYLYNINNGSPLSPEECADVFFRLG